MATPAAPAPNPEDALQPGEIGIIPARPPIAQSRNLLPSFFVEDFPRAEDAQIRVRAIIDIDEPLTIQRGESKSVSFQYRSGVPSSTAFGITWHATEADADALINHIQDEPLPAFEISPPNPRADTGGLQDGIVRLRAPANMRLGIIYGAMAIYQPG